jgi:hypothetical protein
MFWMIKGDDVRQPLCQVYDLSEKLQEMNLVINGELLAILLRDVQIPY